MDKLKMHSPDLTEQNIDKVAVLFPTVVTERLDEGGNPVRAIDFDLLRQELSDHVVEGPQERYQLDWPGKRAALFAANAPVAKTLRPVREESVDFDTTQNLFIEGDNLDALKLLQESYLGKVKLIYIDPPYNTGNDFVYEDDFATSTSEYLERSGQIDNEGRRLAANTESNGRFHSDWLSMMYPRLRLARNLLADDGVIFISIDDNELENLLSMCREVFGTRCHLGTIVWLKKRKGSFLSKGVVSMHEYLVAFGRRPGISLFGGKADSGESQPLVKRTNPTTTLEFPAGVVETKLADGEYPAGTYGQGSSAVELGNAITVADGRVTTSVTLTGPFVWSQAYLASQLASGARVVINTSSLQPRAFKAPSDDGHKGMSSVLDGVAMSATNEDAYEHGRELFGREGVLEYPKPTRLIRELIRASTEFTKDAVVMDFFAGSATTGEAVFQANAEDGGSRRFILVQLDEAVGADSEAQGLGFDTIAALGRERMRIVRDRMLPELTGDPIDLGFRALRIDSTSMAEVRLTPESLEQSSLEFAAESVKPDRTEEDLLFQVLLDCGLELGMPIEVAEIGTHRVYSVDTGSLIACFGLSIGREVVESIASRLPLLAVFRDAAFATDDERINAEQIFAEISPSTDVRVV